MEYNARTRYELHQAVTEWVGSVMGQNNIPAHMMEDALNEALYRVRELAFQEYMRKFMEDYEADRHAAEPVIEDDVQERPQTEEVAE